MYIAYTDRSPLLGRDWLRQLPLQYGLSDIKTSRQVKLNKILQDYSDIFSPGVGKINDVQATLTYLAAKC